MAARKSNRAASPRPASSADAETRTRSISPWVKALVAFHIVGITAWALPRPRAALLNGISKPIGSDWVLYYGDKVRQLEPVAAYDQVSGSWQYWDMFSPDPAQTDTWADGRVEFRDGTSTIVGYPRMYALSIPDKYLKERYRKFYERAGSKDYAFLWPIFAIQLAREVPYDPKNPPVAVTLRRHQLTIVLPPELQEALKRTPIVPQQTEYTNEAYFRYILLPGDLEGRP